MAEKKEQYENKTDQNIFTEDGRCVPSGVVSLTAKQARQYKGLKKCPK